MRSPLASTPNALSGPRCGALTALARVLAMLLAALLALALPGCGAKDAPSASPGGTSSSPLPIPYRVVATTGMIGDLVQAVAGERAAVHTLIAPGVDPHLYRPTRTDTQRLLDAHAIFANGLLLEGRMTQTLAAARSAGKPVHELAESVDRSRLIAADGHGGAFDPHLWMDPSLWGGLVEAIRAHLSALDPAGAGVYAANAQALKADITALDAYAERVLGTVPEASRVLITAHDAFSYFGRRYGFEVLGIQGISTESEAGTRAIEALVSTIVQRRVAAVFVESTVSDRAISALVAGAAARGHTVRIGGTLFSDAMGDAGTYEGTYIGMIDHNVTTIARALGGQAPESGMSGRLTP